jgi:tetratricopeptide (TPR) repeat protein/SAM-dependent methyltransferase
MADPKLPSVSASTTLSVDQALQEAIAYHRAGQLTDAERYYRAILQVQPQHSDANHNLGVLAIGVNQPDAALPFLKAALEANPAQRQYWLSYIDALIRADQSLSARQVVDIARQNGLDGEAIDQLEQRCLDAQPKNVGVVPSPYETAIDYLESGDYQRARAWLQAWLGEHPRDAEAHARLAHVLLLEKQVEAANIAIVQAMAIAPALPVVLRNYARLLLTQENPEAALQAAQSSYQSDPQNPESWLVMAAALSANNLSEQVLPLIERALQARPEYAEAYASRAMLRLRNNDATGALADAEKALTLKPHLTQLWNLIGALRHQLNNLPGAIEALQKVLEYEPDNIGNMVNLGELLRQNGQIDAAIVLLRDAVTRDPENAGAWTNLGTALQEATRNDEAKCAYVRALEINPQSAEIANNLGALEKENGNWEVAKHYFNKALELNHNYVEAYCNLGSVLKEQGQLNEAVSIYQQVLSIKPSYSDAHTGMGNVLIELGKWDEAILSHMRALNLGEFTGSKVGIAKCIKDVSFTFADPKIYHIVQLAISEAWASPNDLLKPGLSLVALNFSVKKCIDRVKDAWPKRLSRDKLFEGCDSSAISDELLLQSLLVSAPLSNIEFEQLLTNLRFIFLEYATTVINQCEEESNGDLVFYCALARQCFINEYVFAYTDEELARAKQLRERLANGLAEKLPVPTAWLIAVAAYFPLTSLPDMDALLNQSWPDSMAALIEQQVKEPLLEQRYRSSIRRVTAIDNDVSRLVQEQYEENPYPRWVKVPICTKTFTVDAYFRQKFPNSAYVPLGKNDGVNILIAGCGTGRHAIYTAQFFRGAKVFAVDLSLTSLGYAKRKTDEIGLGNIEYAQADIMRLGAIEQKFDIIESVGVLHHLADPEAGLQELLKLLRPNGFMRLGLYSNLARQDVVAGRSYIKENRYAANAEDIRKCRQELMAGKNAEKFKKLSLFSDFYGMSGCRDLLFHVQEHRYTLPQIKRNIEMLGLRFIGFDNEYIAKKYMARFSDDPSRTNLDNWHLLESENPYMFAGMYQFWVQKC